jgi:hypothetical protein
MQFDDYDESHMGDVFLTCCISYVIQYAASQILLKFDVGNVHEISSVNVIFSCINTVASVTNPGLLKIIN